MIKVCAFSDGHGILPNPETISAFDVLLIGGDNVDLYRQSDRTGTYNWYVNTFTDWINKLPFNDSNSKVIFIAGNHEVSFEHLNSDLKTLLLNQIYEKTNNRAIYLENETYVFEKDDEKLTIFGTPYCKIFGRWAYMRSDEELNTIYSEIPNNCDILLAHDAPYGTSDLCFGWEKWGKSLEHIGNIPLRDAIIEKNPKICIHGHLHSSNHEDEILNNTSVYCVSLVDEEYRLAYEPLYLEL